MVRKLFVSAVLVLVIQAPAVFSRPLEGPAGRLVQDPVPALQDEVKRLEKEVAREPELAQDLAFARARLAAAEGRTGEARAAWRKIIAAREEARSVQWHLILHKGKVCDESDPAIGPGPVAEARCGLAEAEGDLAVPSGGNCRRSSPTERTSWLDCGGSRRPRLFHPTKSSGGRSSS